MALGRLGVLPSEGEGVAFVDHLLRAGANWVSSLLGLRRAVAQTSAWPRSPRVSLKWERGLRRF